MSRKRSRFRVISRWNQASVSGSFHVGQDYHLRLLRAARILRAERRGKQICYSAADEHIQCVIEDMIAHVGEPGDIEESA